MTINMKKGDAPLSLTKTNLITFSCTWPATTDYDLSAIVVRADNTLEYIATFPAGKKGILRPTYTDPAKHATDDGSVRHLGDARRGSGNATETMEVRLNGRIKAVIPFVYSAKKNGTGSFFGNQVTTEIKAGDQHVVVHANNASNDRSVYTLVPGMIMNKGDTFEVQALEMYSARHSENRPGLHISNGIVTPLMDIGPENARK
ncbi:hypothetical protein ABT282_08675 [Streptomyces sp. NPDC000927]|uniref:hypothetical protein n=1 Tax=Streptomyces sp. NPDC000927 TaxID=3154371 RepID=UPI00332E5693